MSKVKNKTNISILQLTEDEARELTKSLDYLDANIVAKVDYVTKKTGSSYIEVLEYVVTENPVLWAKVYLNWECRDYQEKILMECKLSLNVVLRLGRRLGKSDSMAILILWFSATQYNKGPNDSYEVGIFTPYETQIDLLFKRLNQLVDGSPYMIELVDRRIHHRLEFKNGSIVYGLTAGANSGTSGGNNTRGQKGDVLIFDEADYIGSSQLTNIINIRNEDPGRIKVIAASTPSGKHEEYYKWCTGATKRYAPSQEDIDNYTFSGYILEDKSALPKSDRGNGWVEIFAPSIVNKEIIKIDPTTEQTYLENLKDELSELRFDQEVMANFGDEEMGVYQRRFIEAAIKEGTRVKHRYIDIENDSEIEHFLRHRNGPIIMGIDWDKVQAGTSMVATYFDRNYINEHGICEPKIRVLFRTEIPRSEFTYMNAVEKIVELDQKFGFDWIAVDKGYGDVQLEMLHKYGIQNPETGLHTKTIGYQFGQKIEIRDPHTMKVEKMPFKPTMVNNSVITFEREKIVLDPTDKLLHGQLTDYRIETISSTGMPTYSSENEHALDALNLCLMIFEQKHGTLFKQMLTSKISPINELDREKYEEIEKRDIFLEKEEKPTKVTGMIGFGTGYVGTSRSSGKRTRGMYTRRGF